MWLSSECVNSFELCLSVSVSVPADICQFYCYKFTVTDRAKTRARFIRLKMQSDCKPVQTQVVLILHKKTQVIAPTPHPLLTLQAKTQVIAPTPHPLLTLNKKTQVIAPTPHPLLTLQKKTEVIAPTPNTAQEDTRTTPSAAQKGTIKALHPLSRREQTV